jgi:tetratricopeptide (TPR) repeat protein
MSQGEPEFHRKMARQCFNEAWNYLDKKDRNSSDEQQMLHLAHASRYHWSFVGEPSNLATGDWQISRAYAVLNQPNLALQFAKSALEISDKNNLQELLVSAYEGMARAFATGKDFVSARDYIKKAREHLGGLSLSDEDRKIYSDQIHETEQMISK